MSQWEMVNVGKYVEQIRGVSYKPKESSEKPQENYIPVLRAQNIQDDGLNENNLVYVKKERITLQQKILKGDIVICTSSGSKHLVGKASQAVNDMEASFGAFCKVIRPKNINEKYLGNFFRSKKYRQTISALSAGANINNLRSEHIDLLKIPLPPIEIQQKIAKTLDTAADLLKLRKQQLAELDQLIQSVFYEMFGDPLSNSKGWNTEKLGSITTRITDGKHGDCQNEDGSGFYFISAKDIKNRTISTENARQIKRSDFIETDKRTHLSNGDIVVVNTGATIGKTAIAKEEDVYKNLTFQKSVAIITVNPEIIINAFLEQYIINERENIYKSASGSAQKNWLLSQMRDYKIMLPPVEMQKQYLSFVQQVDKLKIELQKSLDDMNMLFNALMQKYFE